MKTNIKIIATSLALASSVNTWAGIGGLSVHSHLGQPFSGSIVVTGDEAEALKSNRRVVVSGSGIRGSVVPQANGNVVVRLRSSSPIREPMITFSVSAGRQTREYNAMLDPSGYTPEPAPRRVEKPVKEPRRKPAAEPSTPSSGSLKKGDVDFVARTKSIENNTMPVENKRPRATEESSNAENVARPAREPRQPREPRTQNQTAPATTGAVNTVRKSGKTAVSARRHRAQVGETLSAIAERYRPRNMSLQTASRALAMANPAAFKRGNTIQRATTLYIPTASQWHAYAQRAQNHATHTPQQSRRSVAPVQNVDMGVDTATHTQPSPPPATPTQQPQTQTTKPPVANKTPTTQPPAVQGQATQPVQPAQPANTTTQAGITEPAAVGSKAGKPVVASAPVNAPAKPVSAPVAPTAKVASAPIQAASPVAKPMTASPAASIPNASPAPVSSTPAMPQPAMTEPQTLEDMEEGEDTNWVLYGGIAGALGIAAFAAHILRKRRSENATEEDDDDVEWETTSDTSPANRVKPNITSHDDDHDFDVNAQDDDFETTSADEDDVFFTDTSAAAAGVAAAVAAKSAFSLDDFEPDVASFGLDTKAADTDTNNNADDDWTWDTPNSTEAPDGFETLNHTKQTDEANSQDWSLDDDVDLPSSGDYSLDNIDQLTNEIDNTAFSEFGEEDNFIQEAASNKPRAAVDDIDAMFASALANLDDLSANTDTLPETSKPAAELDDIDAMFAGALANLGGNKTESTPIADEDNLFANNTLAEDDELAAFEQPKPKSAAAELDDIDSMFAGALANLDNLAHNTHEDDALMAAAELDSLNSLGEFDDALPAADQTIANPLTSDDDLDALFTNTFSAPATEHVADDIDTMFPNELNELELDSLNSLSELDSFDEEVLNTTRSHPVDDIDAMFANELNELDSLNSLSELDSFGEETLNTTSSHPVDDIDAMFANELNELDNLNSLSELDSFGEETLNTTNSHPVDDIDAMFANELNGLDSLNALSEPTASLADSFAEFSDDELTTSVAVNLEEDIDTLFANELESLNSLSELNDLDDTLITPTVNNLHSDSVFDELAELGSSSPEPVIPDDIDTLFANALSDIDEPLVSEPVIKPIMSEADIENLNSLSELDSLEANEPSADDLFADALNDLTMIGSDMDNVNSLAFETSAPTAIPIEDTSLDDIDSMAFDLSAFDALQNTATEASMEEEVALDNLDAMSFDLSGFDALTETAVEESAFDDVDTLAFATPEIPDAPLDTPELTTPAVDFDLPEVAPVALDDFPNTLSELETAGDFLEFDLPAAEEVGFVSGAVGTGETLEAKLELATMYVEIDDTNAARAMLNELIAEADGEVLAKAKTLLNQLG